MRLINFARKMRLLNAYFSWGRHEEDEDYIPRRTVYSDPHGSVTTDGNAYQVWRRFSQWHVEKVGHPYPTRKDAVQALQDAP